MKIDTSKKVIGLYIILTIIFTYPVAFSLDKIPGKIGDNYFFLWTLWWYKKALLGLSSPYDTIYIFYPTGANLAFSTLTPFNAILSIPLQLIVGLVYTYNILYLISFIIAGYGTYLLVKYLINDIGVAIISGLIFMFSPYHFIHGLVGHLNLLTIEWIPFYILYLFKTVDEDKIRNSIYTAIFLLFVALSEYQYLIFMLFFSLFFLIYYRNKLKLNVIKRLLLSTMIFGMIFFPFAYPLLKEIIISHSNYMYSGGFRKFSADLLGFFVPSRMNPILVKYLPKVFVGISMGYTVLLLASIAILKVKKKEIRFWTLSTLIFLIFSLGPKLHINGKMLDFVPLPYSILMNIPIISMARTPTRWDVLVILSLAVLSGYGLNYLFKENKYIKLNNVKYIMIIISTLIIFEYLAIPVPMSDAKIPQFYQELRKDHENYSIFELPATKANSHYMYYQTLHEKKMVNGYISRQPPYTMKFRKKLFINQLYYLSKNDNITDNITEYGKTILNNYSIRYIILHEQYMKKGQIDIANNLLKNISMKKRYKEDKLIVYRIDGDDGDDI